MRTVQLHTHSETLKPTIPAEPVTHVSQTSESVTYGRIGSICTGTLIPSELADAFISELGYLGNARAAELSARYDGLTMDDDYNTDGAEFSDLVDSACEALEEHAPSYCYFGAHNGDGADYGFWPSWESIADAQYSGELVTLPDGSEMPRIGAISAVLCVSDHGNATLYEPSQDGRTWAETWSIV